jgi:hypothetical protein
VDVAAEEEAEALALVAAAELDTFADARAEDLAVELDDDYEAIKSVEVVPFNALMLVYDPVLS